jgi:hypothetical protein
MAYSDSDELLAAALEQLAREQGDPSLVAHSMFRNGTHLKGTDDEEPHNMNPVLFVDEYGREIKGSMSAEDASRPGLHTQEAVESGAILDNSNMREYTTEDAIQDEVSNALYDELFRMARGKSEFSNEALDKKKQMTDYLNNDQRLIESLIRRGKIKA